MYKFLIRNITRALLLGSLGGVSLTLIFYILVTYIIDKQLPIDTWISYGLLFSGIFATIGIVFAVRLHFKTKKHWNEPATHNEK